MTLRNSVVALALLFAAVALVCVAMNLAAWPTLLPVGLFLAGTLFERARYGRASAEPSGPGWTRTQERFVDDASGRVMTVWFNSQTGERRYVDGGESAIRNI
ncbi:hypothetical protein [Sphingobium sp. Sx8-8]|uniref:hypothetical protein n=1 Tax=Sphingobium sp. Sx8-8 TaxID=2933617 RepID=UPI001F570B59|nr:hypothetical protein [Sphingobium sp. Sx8-8]